MALRSSAATATRSGLWSLIPYFLIAYLYFYIVFVQPSSLSEAPRGSLQKQLGPTSAVARGGSSAAATATNDALQRRVHQLETKLNTYLSFGSDPFLAGKTPAKCRNTTQLSEYCPKASSCHLGMPVCLDDFPKAPALKKKSGSKAPCLVYDFGIRKEPDFGVILASAPFGCEVHAFDPSPITKAWYKSDAAKDLRENNKNYQLHDYGGGGADENLVLREYNWDQISIYSYPSMVLNPNNCTSQGRCRYHKFPIQKKHILPVRSVESVMKELGHTHIDVLKLDVEGSEYRMLEAIIESGVCKEIDQLTLEWHHYDFDLRYGAASIPMLNVIVKLLQEECGLHQHWIHDATGWPSNEKIYSDMGVILRYNLAAFMRIK
jgi:FkbM family methyltransferase